MTDPLQELADMESGTSSAVPDDAEGQEAEAAHPSMITERFGDIDNDPVARAKLAASYVEANNFTGRQGQELGQTRQQLEQLQAQMAELQQQRQAPPEPDPAYGEPSVE